MIINTKRLILRPFEQGDVNDYFKIFSNKIVNTFLPCFLIQNIDEAQKSLNKKLTDKNTKIFLALELKENKKVIGYLNLSNKPSFDFGYGLLPKYWERGYISEAAKAFIEYLKTTNIPYITATHDIHNLHSGYVMRSIGMVYKYSYVEFWKPKEFYVTFRMYQLDFKDDQPLFDEYKNLYPYNFVEQPKYMEINFFQKLNPESFQQFFGLLERNFPKDEYRSYQHQKNLMKKNNYQIFVTLDNSNLFVKAAVALWTFDNFYYIEHLVVNKDYRNNRQGSKILNQLTKFLDRIIILEVEPPTNSVNKKRISFYLKNNFFLNEYPYIMPALENDKNPLELNIMSSNRLLSETEFTEIKNILYSKVYQQKN